MPSLDNAATPEGARRTITEQTIPPEVRQDPRVAASNSFTNLGKRMLEKGNADGAIRMLERAVGINPNDGPGYYYLAEAWLMKNNPGQAEQFNRLARIHLGRIGLMHLRADEQHRRIEAALARQ